MEFIGWLILGSSLGVLTFLSLLQIIRWAMGIGAKLDKIIGLLEVNHWMSPCKETGHSHKEK